MKYCQSVYRISIVLFIVFSTFSVFSQKSKTLLRQDQWISEFAIESTNSVMIQPGYPVTAIAIKATEGNFEVLINKEWTTVPADPDAPEKTWFLSLPQPQVSIALRSDKDQYELFLIKSGKSPKISERKRTAQDVFCDTPPPLISQNEWRQGLPRPNYNRSFTDIELLVVHHSAGSNSSTDFVQVVRDIYLYHTEVNGWSDIGYNYLVAQDGSLFAGRDPAGGGQLTVRGAHFCGNNSGTSGICMLGNFETAIPSDPSLDALRSLLTFAFYSLEIDPTVTTSHSTGIQHTLSGHRDGCSTLCPGENLYTLLPELRVEISEQLADCGLNVGPSLSFTVENTVVRRFEPVIFSNESSGYEAYFWNTEGGKKAVNVDAPVPVNSTVVSYETLGYFDVELVGRYAGTYDTLLLEKYIHVSDSQDEPLVYPNPVRPLESLSFDFGEVVQQVVIKNLSGQVIVSALPEYNSFTMPVIEPGLYLIEIRTLDRAFTRRIIIE